MSRKGIIFCLTHGYPLFLALHLYFGDWCRFCQVLFNIIPLIVFGYLLYIWVNTSNRKLGIYERFCIRYLIGNLAFVTCYYELCIFSKSEWIYDKNWQLALFLIVTLIFYIFYKRERT
jgi:hypothetical protein